MAITTAQLRSVAGTRAKASILDGTVAGLFEHGLRFGLDRPHRLAHFLAQIAHESARFATTVEYWGPTAAQKRYEGRADLGNTQSGDGSRFRGRGLIQLTGRYNYRKFTTWARSNFPGAPNFESEPEKVAEFPWALLASVWYWHVGNPTGRSLNVYADRNDAEMITRRINGGLNGYQDRLTLYTRTALVLLGYQMTTGAIARFQADAGLLVDDISGPRTRTALHEWLTTLEPSPPVEIDPPEPIPPVQPEPALPDDPDEETEMNNTFQQVIRIALYTIGGAIFGDAITEGEMFQSAVGGLIAAASFVWWYYWNKTEVR